MQPEQPQPHRQPQPEQRQPEQQRPNPLGAASPPPPAQWQRLSPWAIGTRVVKAIPSLLPALIGLIFLGRSAGPVGIALAAIALGVLVGLVPWLTTTYRVTEAQLEVRSGLLRRQTATARRDRVRSVDVTAGPLERILGVRKVMVGTGVGGDKKAIVLDPLPRAEAEALNVTLLRRAPAARGGTVGPDTGAAGPAPAPPDEEIARLQPSWIRFAPYSLTGFAFVAAAVGIGFRILNDAGIWESSAERAAGELEFLSTVSPVVLVVGGVVVLLVLGVSISVLAYVLAFWGFRLVRRPDGALHTSRGLLSTATATIERKRVRGAIVHEPILMRPPGGAKVHAIATGQSRRALLLPPAPRAVAIAVADEVLDRPGTAMAPLHPHGPAARRRRYTRAALATGVPAVVLAVVAVFLPPLGRWPLLAVAVLLAAAVGLAAVRAANLGSATVGDAVVLGAPTVARTRTVIEFDGVVGAVTSDSIFQRRAGVTNLTLATAAGAHTAVDLPPDRAAGVAAAVAPAWVTPFLDAP